MESEKMNYLLRFFDEHQPRRVRVIENTLKNRRTVSTLFWASQYGLLNWTGSMRSLERQQFDQMVKELLQDKLIQLDEDGQARLTSSGVLKQEELKDEEYQPKFFDWYWLANTKLVEERLLLGIQVASELAYHNRFYAPVTNDYQNQKTVKAWALGWNGDLVKQLTRELDLFGNSVAGEDERLANYFFYSLIGHHLNGMTDQEFSSALSLPLSEIPILKHDALLAITAFANSYHGALNRLLADLVSPSPLAYSSYETLLLYERGESISQIAKRRRIKENTVREHLLEVAIVWPEKVNWDNLLPREVREQLAEAYQGEIENWHFDSAKVPGGASAFFYFRLFQIYQERNNVK